MKMINKNVLRQYWIICNIFVVSYLRPARDKKNDHLNF